MTSPSSLFRRESLERRDYGASFEVDRRFSQSAGFSAREIGDRLIYTVTQAVYSKRLERLEVRFEPVTYPEDWWQAVKCKFAPQWFRRRWPVCNRMVTRPPVFLEAHALYPKAPQVPGDPPILEFVAMDAQRQRVPLPEHETFATVLVRADGTKVVEGLEL